MKIATIKPLTVPEAAAKLDRYATLFVDVQRANAKTAKAVAKLQEANADANKDALSEMAQIELILADFAKENKILFEDKRKLKTAMASLGLQKSSEIVIADEAAFIIWAKAKELLDLFKVDEKPVKPACKVRIEAGETLPGVTKSDFENINIKVAKHLLAEVESAAE